MKTKKSNTGSFLSMRRGSGDVAAQKKAKKALLSDWANMSAVPNFADADEVMDPMEAQDYVLSATHHLVANEEETIFFFEELDFEEEVESEESPEPVILFDNYYESMFDLESVLLGKNDAKLYARSAVPAFRGRMNLNILRIANRQVFA